MSGVPVRRWRQRFRDGLPLRLVSWPGERRGDRALARVPCHARINAPRTVARSAELSRTLCSPWRPQAPLDGSNMPGLARMNARCSSGVSLTIPERVAGMEAREDLSVDAEVGVAHVLAFDGTFQFEHETAKVVGGHRREVEASSAGADVYFERFLPN